MKLPIKEIKPAAYNPRRNLQPGDPEYKKLKRSIEEFNLVEPLVWNRRTGNLMGGHQRLKALKELGAKEVEVSVVDLPPEKERLSSKPLFAGNPARTSRKTRDGRGSGKPGPCQFFYLCHSLRSLLTSLPASPRPASSDFLPWLCSNAPMEYPFCLRPGQRRALAPPHFCTAGVPGAF